MTVGIAEPRPEVGVRITYPQRRVALPTSEEFEKLLSIVTARWPQLQRSDGAEFVIAFNRILRLGRRQKLDTERGLAFWTDDVRAWQHQHQISPNVFVGGVSFTAAVLAQNDVDHTMSDRYPFDLSFALQFGGGGHPSTDSWREGLATGRLLEPAPLPRLIETRSPVRIQQLAIGLSGYK
jgi:hypothetical protein